MWLNPRFPADLVRFNEEILNGKLFCAVNQTWLLDCESSWIKRFLSSSRGTISTTKTLN